MTNLLRQKPLTQSVEALRTKEIYYVEIVVVDGAQPPEPMTPMRRSRDLKIYLFEFMMITGVGRVRQLFESVQLVPKNEKKKNKIKD